MTRKQRWEAYFAKADEEERRRMERIYEHIMYEREKAFLREKLWHFYHRKPEGWKYDGADQSYYSSYNRQRNYQTKRKNSALTSKVDKSKKVLGIKLREALTEEKIKAAFRSKALEFHPDR